MKKRGLRILIVLWALLLVVVYGIDRKKDQQRVEHYRQVDTQTLPFRLEQGNLEKQLTTLESYYKSSLVSKPSLELLFTEPGNKFMDEIEPEVTIQKLTGILGLSLKQLSGQAEMISPEYIQKLLGQGWSWCLYYDGNQGQEFSAWLKEAETLYTSKKLPKPTMIYFASDTYSPNLDTQLANAGFSIIINQGKDKDSLDEEAGKLWRTEAFGWSTMGIAERLVDTISNRSNIVLTVGGGSKDEVYEKNRFQNMLYAIRRYSVQNGLVIKGMEAAKEQFLIRVGVDRQKKIDYEKKKSDLEKRLEELNHKINEIYKLA